MNEWLRNKSRELYATIVQDYVFDKDFSEKTKKIADYKSTFWKNYNDETTRYFLIYRMCTIYSHLF
jgi:hypothetical protein